MPALQIRFFPSMNGTTLLHSRMDSCYPCRNYAIVRLGQDGVPSSKASPMNCQDGTLAQGCCGIVPEDIDRLIKLRKL